MELSTTIDRELKQVTSPINVSTSISKQLYTINNETQYTGLNIVISYFLQKLGLWSGKGGYVDYLSAFEFEFINISRLVYISAIPDWWI